MIGKVHSACDMLPELSGHGVHRCGTLNLVHLEPTVTSFVTGGERNTPQNRRLERQTTSALEQRLSSSSEATCSLPLPLQRDSLQMSSSGVSHV